MFYIETKVLFLFLMSIGHWRNTTKSGGNRWFQFCGFFSLRINDDDYVSMRLFSTHFKPTLQYIWTLMSAFYIVRYMGLSMRLEFW